MFFANLVVHGCVHNGIDVFALGEHFTYWPPPRMAGPMQDTFANFAIEWYEGMVCRDGFHVEVPYARPGDNHYDLVIEGDDLQTARVGLRPWKGDQPDLETEVLWAEQKVVEHEPVLPWFMR